MGRGQRNTGGGDTDQRRTPNRDTEIWQQRRQGGGSQIILKARQLSTSLIKSITIKNPSTNNIPILRVWTNLFLIQAWEIQSTPESRLLQSCVCWCENCIVYCADRIRCFPGKRRSQEVQHFIGKYTADSVQTLVMPTVKLKHLAWFFI